MYIHITEEALTWFKEEIGITEGNLVKFYTKIYGNSPVQEGYTLAFTKENYPISIGASTILDGITFYIEESDLWFFNGHNLVVEYESSTDEIVYRYV